MRHFRSTLVVAVLGALVAVAVVAHAAAPAGRYTVTSGTVYDGKTALTWEQVAPLSTYTMYAQAAAVAHCANLTLNGRTGWRLPTAKELNLLVDFSVASPGPTLDATAFPGTPAGLFWSSTPLAGSPNRGWVVDFSNGTSVERSSFGTYYARCVH